MGFFFFNHFHIWQVSDLNCDGKIASEMGPGCNLLGNIIGL